MNIKKIAALLAASAIVCSFPFTAVYADEAEEETAAVQTEDSVSILSEDSLWEYTIQTDEETGEEYACLESYYGNDTEITIPNEIDGNIVRKLGDYAFYENENATKFIISENITDFGNFPFFGCTSLKEFEVDEGNEIYEAPDGVLLGDDDELFVCYPAGKTETEYTVPDGVIALNPAAFAVCKNLKTVNFPDTLERMGLFCFAECTSLNNVVIPESVTELSEFNFTGCTALTDISLPDTMHTIGPGAFSKCTALNSIEFPMYLQEIGQAAFASTGFTEIEIPYTVQAIGYSAFGFTTDQSGQLIAMSSFTVKGLEGSTAQSYCAEEGNEHITFEAVEEEIAETEAEENKDTDKKTGMKTGVIAAIVLGCGAAVVIAVMLCFSARSRRSSYEPDEYDEESGNLTDENEEDETESEEAETARNYLKKIKSEKSENEE